MLTRDLFALEISNRYYLLTYLLTYLLNLVCFCRIHAEQFTVVETTFKCH